MKTRYLFTLLLAMFMATTSFGQRRSGKKIQVGVFDGNGASPVCVTETIEALKIDKGIYAHEVSAVDIMNGVLDKLDVLVFPGGSASKEYNNLGLEAAAKVKTFASKKHKGLVGICAGGYLFSTTPGYPSLELFPAPDIRDHYDRGRALIGFTLNKAGKKIFPELKKTDTAFYQYYDGPMYDIPENAGIKVLATITSDISHKKGYPKGVTPGKPAFFTANYGDGKIIASVGHPEATPGMRWMVPRMARYVAGKRLTGYKRNVVRPEIYTKEEFYTPDVIAFEKENFWKLFSKNDQEIMQAIDSLHSIYSRPSIRWSIGLLRHTSPIVRQHAAQYLAETEYTAAIPDIQAAYAIEKDEPTKEVLRKVLVTLRGLAQ